MIPANQKLIEMFATPVWTATLPPITDEEFEYIKNMEYIRHTRPHKDLHLTKKTYVLDTEEPLANLRDNIKAAVEYYWHNVINVAPFIGLRPLHSWVTRHEPGQQQPWHQDVNSLIAAAVYIRAPENSGDLTLRKDLNLCNMFPNLMEIKYHTDTPFNSREWRITPYDNMIAIFPAHIEHQSEMNMSDETRYCLVQDFWPTGVLNKGLDDGVWDQPIY